MPDYSLGVNDFHRRLRSLKRIAKDADETAIRLGSLMLLLIYLYHMIMHELRE